MILFKKLINDVYIIESLSKETLKLKYFRNKIARFYKYPILVFIYSSIIYFGLKMDIDKMKFKHLFLTLYLFLFYLIGLVLLFYVAGLLLMGNSMNNYKAFGEL